MQMHEHCTLVYISLFFPLRAQVMLVVSILMAVHDATANF